MTQKTQDSMDFANRELLVALQAVAEHNTPEARTAFYDALLDSTLILPTPESEEPDAATELQAQDDIGALRFVTFENDADDVVMIAFTSEDAALTWEPEGLPYIGLRGRDLILIAAENDVAEIVLNPASPTSYRLERDEIIALARGESPAYRQGDDLPHPQGVTVLVGPPMEEPPSSWRKGLSEILSHYPSIETAYLFELHVPPRGQRTVIGLVLYEGMTGDAQNRVMDDMLAEIREQLPQGQSLDFVVLDDPNFLATVRDTVPAIYRASL